MLSRFMTNAEKSIGVSMSSSNEVRGFPAQAMLLIQCFEVRSKVTCLSLISQSGFRRVEELVDLDSLDFRSLDDSESLLDFLLFVPRSDPADGS
ncbi:hypothetical protein Tco_0443027 [Tanacetum coccineum]